MHNDVKPTNAFRDVGKIRIEIRPDSPQGVPSFQDDVERLVASHLTDFSLSGDSVTAIVLAADNAFNRKGIEPLQKDAIEQELQVRIR